MKLKVELRDQLLFSLCSSQCHPEQPGCDPSSNARVSDRVLGVGLGRYRVNHLHAVCAVPNVVTFEKKHKMYVYCVYICYSYCRVQLLTIYTRLSQ